MASRREYGTGSVYQRASDWRWVATIEAGWHANGTRRRVVVSGKGCDGGCKPRCKHRTEVNKRIAKKRQALERGEIVTGTSERTTVKRWAEEYLSMRLHDLRPKAYNAAANPIRRWVIPTIGHRRLTDLTPADLRAVAEAQRKAGRQPNDTHRATMTMLRAAAREGHAIPQPALMAKAPPPPPKSDRASMTVPEGLAVLNASATLDHGSRWLMTMLYGMRLGECLGLTWDAIDFDAGVAGEAVIQWQLQSLPYNTPRDRTSGFRVPDGHEVRHLVDSYHLVRPKSDAGYRVAPLLPPVRDALLRWRDLHPENEWGLVWPTTKGRPANEKHDREEWWAVQATAEVGHPAGRPYHVHECRNFAATMLLEAGVDEHVVKALLGHSSIVMSRKYMTVRREPLLEAMQRVADRLQLG